MVKTVSMHEYSAIYAYKYVYISNRVSFIKKFNLSLPNLFPILFQIDPIISFKTI